MTNSNVERVEVLSAAPARTGWRWTPAEGEETRTLLDSLVALKDDPSARARVLDEARDILARCAPPAGVSEGAETGLAIGYVQSGKTMSFTTVAALARDNRYRMVIVVTGISKALTWQSRDRLVRDLRILTRSDRPWQFISEEKPSPWAHHRDQVRGTLEAWRDPASLPQDRKTVLIAVMKHHLHLEAVTSLFQSIGRDVLRETPTLIIDDEADQAGLNTLAQQNQQNQSNNQSTTYSRLLALRSELPAHSYLQYTATPQAPLLINLIDVLSPRFAALLTPGQAYVGGHDFFEARPSLFRVIPPGDIPQRNRPLPEPPTSLLDALRIFILGVAAGDVLDSGRGNRSMLVHPTHLTNGHTLYAGWIREIAKQWSRVLALPADDPDRKELLEEFKRSYEDLVATLDGSPPSFDTLQQRLLAAIRHTHILVVNASGGPTPKVDWSSSYSFILIGGQAMDRGFTVEGLTVTYMPRGIGDGNADTVQQRARFFGYKKPYRGYCRVYLDTPTRDAFHAYVTHEEDLRGRLQDHFKTGRPLKDWRREFLLTGLLRPTRAEVIGVPYVRETVEGDTWIWMRRPHADTGAMAENTRVIEAFLAKHGQEFTEYPGSPQRTLPQRPRAAEGLDLKEVFEMLTSLQFSYLEDSQRFTAALLVIGWYLRAHEHERLPAAVIEMGTDPTRRVREHQLDDDGLIKNIFQGEAPVAKERRGSIYPGDKKIRFEDRVTVQLHRLRLTKAKTGEVVAPFAYTIAITVPTAVAEGVVLQPQGGGGS